MAQKKEALKDRLARYREIQLTVTGRKSGKKLTRPVWFVVENDTLYLLPVEGSDSQWYKNVLHDPRIRVAARDATEDLEAALITDAPAVQSVVERFREKYGAGDVKKYYSKFDVAVQAKL